MRKLTPLSGRVKKIPSTQADAGRYTFLNLENAEPDLGVPLSNGQFLTSDTNGNRIWVDSSATTGFTGSKGDTGFTGSQGDIGFTGSQGTQGIAYAWIKVTSNYTASNNQGIVADTSGGIFDVTLPASPSIGDSVLIGDGADWSINNLTVLPSGSDTIEGATSFVLDIAQIKAEFVWDGLQWQSYINIGAASSNPVPSTETVGIVSLNAGTGQSTLDLSTGNLFNVVSTNSTTGNRILVSNPPISGTAIGFSLNYTPVGTYDITWEFPIVWAGGTPPDAPLAGETNVYVFFTQDGGTTYYGFLAGAAMA